MNDSGWERITPSLRSPHHSTSAAFPPPPCMLHRPQVPQALIEELRPGGLLLIPVGPQGACQDLLLIDRRADGRMRTRKALQVSYVPLTSRELQLASAL